MKYEITKQPGLIKVRRLADNREFITDVLHDESDSFVDGNFHWPEIGIVPVNPFAKVGA